VASVKIKRGRAKPLWFGHPWLYSQAVDKVSGEVEAGDVVDVVDDEGRFIGRGFYNPDSQIAVRMLTRDAVAVDADFLAQRLRAAKALRARLGLPSPTTTAYRLVNAEGDALPGLNVDVYGDVVTVQITALGMKRLEALVYDALQALLSPRAIYAVAAGGVTSREGFTTAPGIVRGEEVKEVRFLEHGVALAIDPEHGQKTGAFLDQRENHRRVGSLCAGADVLDCYTYLGGFALQALAQGARRATAIDMSPRAIERARQHAAWAGVADRLELVEADVFRWLEAAPARAYDVLIVDPPKFAPSKSTLESALKGYRKLNAMAMGCAREGAILATASCSQAVDVETFERTLAAAAVDARRRITVLETLHQPADHPVPPGFTEGRYLKMLLLRVE
jgi:23S rRNA (cytosine1962-C5)-methyltransferase